MVYYHINERFIFKVYYSNSNHVLYHDDVDCSKRFDISKTTIMVEEVS